MKPDELTEEKLQEVAEILAANNASDETTIKVYYADEENVASETKRLKLQRLDQLLD